MTGAGSGAPEFYATPRGPSSSEELAIQWDHPVHQEEVRESEHTAARKVRRALGIEEAFRAVAGDDVRPLLVLRECLSCTGTDDALLTRDADNEKTMLMSRWFHCVKLPPDVLDEDHPFHALFAGESPGHLFLSARDGAGRQDLRGDQARVELWKKMEARLAQAYLDQPGRPLERLSGLLGELDQVDSEIAEAESRLDAAVEEDGPGSKAFEKISKELDALKEERSELRSEFERASQLGLRPQEDASAPRSS